MVLSLDGAQEQSSVQIDDPLAKKNDLTPIMERYDETTDNNLLKKISPHKEEATDSPIYSQTMRSDQKML